MGRSGELESKNDKLISEVINDPLFRIQRNGRIFSRITENGQGISDDWREVGYEKKDGYIRFRYKGEFLFAHRVIYRKFKGPLSKDLTVNHKNKDNSDNRLENLELIPQSKNNEHKLKNAALLKKVLIKLSK